MPVKVIIWDSPFSSNGKTFYTKAKTVREIITEINNPLSEDHARVMIDGEIVTDFSIVIPDGCTVWIKFVPGGADNKETGGIMKGAGSFMIALGVLVAAVTSWTGIGAFLGAAIIGAGVGMLSGGIAMYSLNIPEFGDREKPEQNPSVRGSQNQARPRGVIPVLFGRHLIYPDIAAAQFTQIKSDDQYLIQLFCCGYNNCEIDTSSIKLGDTLLAEFSATKDIDAILSGKDSLIQLEIIQDGRAPLFYQKTVHEEPLNVLLKNKNEDGTSGAIIRTTPAATEELNVDIFLYNGIGKYNDKGKVEYHQIQVAAYYKPDGTGDSQYQLLGYFNNTNNVLGGSELKTKRFQVTKAGLAAGKYTVKIERTTGDSSDSNIVDAVYVGAIRSLKSTRPIREERQKNLTVIALKTKATDKINGTLDRFNLVAQSNLPAYSGSGSGSDQWKKSKPSSNPASCLLYTLQGAASQQRVDDSDIDWFALERYYRWCESRKYECNAFLSESVTISELLKMIGSTSRAEILRINSLISVIQDIARDSPVQLFTPKNSVSYKETIVMSEIPDALKMGFIDKTSGYVENELFIYNTPDGSYQKEPDTTQDVNLWGVTLPEQAQKIGMYDLGCSRVRPVVYSLQVDIEYLMCVKGDWIQYAGDIALVGITQGRVKETIISGDFITGFIIDEQPAIDQNKIYGIRIRKADGTIILENIIPADRPDFWLLSDPLQISAGFSAGDIYALGYRGQETRDLIITDIQPAEDLSATLTCVDYSPELFSVDDPGFILPEWKSKITDVAYLGDSGIVNPAEWSTYQTYHDSSDLPSIPTGDGTADGWHRISTTQSQWVSSKTAKTVTDGQWSFPAATPGKLAGDLANGNNIGNPDIPSNVQATAYETQITLSSSVAGSGLGSAIKQFFYSVSKDKGKTWEEFESQASVFNYLFDRDLDGYPEATDLIKWLVRAKVENIYSKQSEWSMPIGVNTSTYGTWVLNPPTITQTISRRVVTLTINQPLRSDGRNVYGRIINNIEIRKPGHDPDDVWYRPAVSADPYASEDNYKNGFGFEEAGEIYTQALPLSGQNHIDPDGKPTPTPEDTLYQFRLRATSDASDSGFSVVNIIAKADSLQDMVDRAITGNKIAEGAILAENIHGNTITADKMDIKMLSAIAANLGYITGGIFEGTELNRWALTTVRLEDGTVRYEGAMRVGGVDQFLEVIPVKIIGGIPQDYEIRFKVGAFEITSTASNINGILHIQKNETALDRTRITPTGTFYEHRNSTSSHWEIIAKQETRGLLSPLMYSESSLTLTNAGVSKRRRLGHDIGRPYISAHSRVYHFDTDLFDQNGDSVLKYSYIDTPPVLVNEEDNSDESIIDFTPAILAVSPYSEVGRSLYGRYSLRFPLGSASELTVDCWIQYIWAENQTVLDAGTPDDRLLIVISSGEPNYNDLAESEIPYNEEITESDRLVYNEVSGAENYIIHQGLSRFESRTFSDEGIVFGKNSWIHIAVILTDSHITLFADDKKVTFTRYSLVPSVSEVVFNKEKNSFILDELFFDGNTAESFEDFIRTTQNKIPFAALDYTQKWFILDADDTSKIKTNIFNTAEFESAVLALINENRSLL